MSTTTVRRSQESDDSRAPLIRTVDSSDLSANSEFYELKLRTKVREDHVGSDSDDDDDSLDSLLEDDASQNEDEDDEDAMAAADEGIIKLLTLVWHELPAWRQDNIFITSGYRRETLSAWKCIESLTYLHNESVNIYSHLVGSLFFLIFLGFTLAMFLPRYESTTGKDYAVFIIFFLGAVLCLGMSSTYHCINCHSESVAKFGNRLDYIGIICLILGSFVPAIFYGLHALPQYMPFFFVLVGSLGIICTVVTLRPIFIDPSWRPFRALLFVAFGCSGVIPITFGGITQGSEELWNRVALGYMLTEGGLYITGAAIYAARVPERFKPGSFDLLGSSHQIFHLFVVAAAVCHLKGIINAYNFCHASRAGL
ncbi:hemolysin-III related-domain-containing protein [Lipomyces oligophaga]|uniref:hemolysin-III related-domain-containing protein n=1 Tax=Lipomyces oligophaga TaxID=45792 RepID=UPI0034CDEEEC